MTDKTYDECKMSKEYQKMFLLFFYQWVNRTQVGTLFKRLIHREILVSGYEIPNGSQERVKMESEKVLSKPSKTQVSICYKLNLRGFPKIQRGKTKQEIVLLCFAMFCYLLLYFFYQFSTKIFQFSTKTSKNV